MILQIKPFIGLSVLFLSVFFSCGQTKKTEGLEVIPIEAAYLHPTTLKASDYFRKIRYVPLETNDHALVGSDPVVWISGDRLIVSSNQNNVCHLIKLQVASLARSDISGMIRKVASRFSAG